MKIRINFIERKFHRFVSIERVFRQVEKGLNADRFEISFQQLPYLNNLLGMIRNVIFFRPKTDADIYHVTGDCHYITLVLPSRKTVLTIHDLGFLHRRSGLRRWVLKKILLDLPLRKLKFITAISEATKSEILKFCDIEPEKIRVVENPLDEFFVATEQKEFDSASPNILQIGTSPHKNVLNLIRALEGLDCRLTLIGDLDEATKNELEAKKIRYVNKCELDEIAIRNEYKHADIVSLCSTYEGFGLPIIEAQAMRKPVITSNISPLKDVAGEGSAMFVDPYDFKTIRSGIKRLIDYGAFRETLIQSGLKNIERFRKQTIAAKYEMLYEEIINKNSK